MTGDGHDWPSPGPNPAPHVELPYGVRVPLSAPDDEPRMDVLVLRCSGSVEFLCVVVGQPSPEPIEPELPHDTTKVLRKVIVHPDGNVTDP